MVSKQITLDGVGLNTLRASDPVLVVNTLDGWYGSPPKKTSYTPLPYGPGSYYTPAYDDVRSIKIAGTVYAQDPARLIRQQRILNGLCRDPNTLAQLRVDDAAGSLFTGVQRTGELLVTQIHDLALTYSMALTCPDPRLFDVNTQSTSTPMAQAGTGGAAWNGPSPGTSGTQWNGPAPGVKGISWGQPTSTGFVTLDNTLGNAYADILFTIVGPVQLPAISTSTNWIRYNGSLAANDVLTINTGSGAVLLNGVNRRPLLTQAQFFQIPAGQSIAVRYTADIQNSTSYMTATWRTSIL